MGWDGMGWDSISLKCKIVAADTGTSTPYRKTEEDEVQNSQKFA